MEAVWGDSAMDSLTIGIIGFVSLLALLAVRIPIGVAMLGVGMVGYTVIAGDVALLSYLKTEIYWQFTADALSVAPAFPDRAPSPRAARSQGRGAADRAGGGA